MIQLTASFLSNLRLLIICEGFHSNSYSQLKSQQSFQGSFAGQQGWGGCFFIVFYCYFYFYLYFYLYFYFYLSWDRFRADEDKEDDVKTGLNYLIILSNYFNAVLQILQTGTSRTAKLAKSALACCTLFLQWPACKSLAASQTALSCPMNLFCPSPSTPSTQLRQVFCCILTILTSSSQQLSTICLMRVQASLQLLAYRCIALYSRPQRYSSSQSEGVGVFLWAWPGGLHWLDGYCIGCGVVTWKLWMHGLVFVFSSFCSGKYRLIALFKCYFGVLSMCLTS